MRVLTAGVAWLTLYPDGTVHDEERCRDYRADGLYERLLYAGVPLWSQTDGSRDGCIQVHTDGRQVTALLDADDRRTVIPGPDRRGPHRLVADRPTRPRGRLTGTVRPAQQPKEKHMTDMPTWDEMTDVDKGVALLHLWKRDAEGASYAVENYPAQYLDDPRLVALDGPDACRHAVAVGVSDKDAEKRLGLDEYGRLYELARAEPKRRMLWAARNEMGRAVPVETRERAVELLTRHWPANDDRYAAQDPPPSWWSPTDRLKWALLQRTEAGGEWTEVELTSAAN